MTEDLSPNLKVQRDTGQGQSKNLGRKKKILIVLTQDDGVAEQNSSFDEQSQKMS